MATANPIRSQSRVSGDRSGSCSDDVLSLDSWSEKLDTPFDWPVELDSKHSRIPSAGHSGSRTGFATSHNKLAGRKHPSSDVKKEKSLILRSGPPASHGATGSRNDSISTISGDVQNRDHITSISDGILLSPRRSASSTSSDSESSPLHSPRHTVRDNAPHSRRIPPTGTHYSPKHFQFAHHLRPHYQSSPIHRGTPGHPASSAGPHRTHPSHLRDGGHIHHRGVPYYTDQFPHQNSYAIGNSAHIDQIFEREGEKIKTKMKSMWNNVKYGWTLKTKTSFKYDSPIFLLGRCYHRRADEGDQQYLETMTPQQQQYKVEALDEFNADFTSRLWFTYRREFAPIGSAKMTTDCGWGCMLRSGQMMMAQGLVHHFLRRDWRVYSAQRPEDLAFYREIIRWFGDHPSDKMPFSLHRLVELGTSVGKMPGDWYGPASVAHIFKDAMDKAHASLPILSSICVYVAQDCTIYLEDLTKIMSSHTRSDSQLGGSITESDNPHPPSSSYQYHPPHHHHQQQQHCRRTHRSDSVQEEKFRSVIVLVPMRLGGETLNEIYTPCVKSMLANDFCIGIIGGRPKHSLYFVGWQEDKLIYLDPHYCQDTVDTSQASFPIQSFHCMSPRKMLFSKMDPSCTVGFYCRSKQELQTFIDQVPDMVVPPKQRGQYPLFVVSEGSSIDHHLQQPPARELGRLRIRHVHTDHAGNRVRSPTLDSEDFVIL